MMAMLILVYKYRVLNLGIYEKLARRTAGKAVKRDALRCVKLVAEVPVVIKLIGLAKSGVNHVSAGGVIVCFRTTLTR